MRNIRITIVFLFIVIVPVISSIKYGFWPTIGAVIIFFFCSSIFMSALDKNRIINNKKTELRKCPMK